ncbi:MAG: hypothetical protein ABSG42_03395 [Nitrospirota bacterium]
MAATAYAATVEDVTRALDNAQNASDISREAAVIESMIKAGDRGPDVYTQLARAYYLLGEGEPGKQKKLAYLEKAAAAADKSLARKKDPVALYWRSMALLQEADATGGLRALSMVKEALRGLEEVAKTAPRYDEAGAYRSWGKVLIDAPGWTFIGDKKKGMALLQKAKEIAPDNLVNRLYLAQAFIKNGLRAEARTEAQYIVSAPLNQKNLKDDLETKDEAEKLLKEGL